MDVAEGEAAQERAQRARGADAASQPAHAAVAQQVQVGERIRAGDHPGIGWTRLPRELGYGSGWTCWAVLLQPVSTDTAAVGRENVSDGSSDSRWLTLRGW